MFKPIALLLGVLLANVVNTSGAHGESLQLNGIGVQAQNGGDSYFGALWLGWPADTPATIRSMPGRKHLDLHVNAPNLRGTDLARQWNQLITANNSVGDLNDSALDIVAFLEAIRIDFVRGDKLVVELASDGSTRVFLNGATVAGSGGPGLFNILLNTWIGPHPPSADFQAGLLKLDTGASGRALLANLQGLPLPTARRQQIAQARALAPQASVRKHTAPPVAPVAPTPPPTETKPVAKVTRTPPPAPKPPVVPIEEPAAPPVPAPTTNTPTAPATTVAMAAPTASANLRQRQLHDDYLRFVRQRITQNTRYPRAAAKAGIEGLVVLRLTLDRAGEIAALALVPSGQKALDVAAERAARRAAPFTPPDTELAGDRFDVAVPIVFKLQL